MAKGEKPDNLINMKIGALIAWFFTGIIGGHAFYVGRTKWGLMYLMILALFLGSILTPVLVDGGAYANAGAILRSGCLAFGLLLIITDFVRIIFFDFCVVDEN